MSSLLDVCPHGAWISEEDAIQFLGLKSQSALKEAFSEGSLPHVFVEHGKRCADVSHPFNKHRFFFVQNEGKDVGRPSINFAAWVGLCESLEEGAVDSLNSVTQARIREYTDYTNVTDACRDLKRVRGIISSSELSGEDGDDGYYGYQYGSNGGTARPPGTPAEGEIFTRADGKRVRRVRRSSSTHAGSGSKGGTLAGFIEKDKDDSDTKSKKSGSRSVGKGDGVKRSVRRSSSLHAGSMSQAASLSGFLSKNDKSDTKSKKSGSRSVGALESRSVGAIEGSVYTRSDGKKGEYKNYSDKIEEMKEYY